MAPGMCLKITVQNHERILDAVDNVALETVREALLQHRHTMKHISHGSVRPSTTRRPQRKAGRLDARFSSLSIPSVIIEEQENDMCGDSDRSQRTGTICDTVSTPRRKLRKLEYIKNIVGCQNLPRLGCGESGGTLKDMVSQSDRSQCQDNHGAVCVPTGETGGLGSGDQSQNVEEEITVTEKGGRSLGTDQGDGNMNLSESSVLLGNREETITVLQVESVAESSQMTEVNMMKQDVSRIGGSLTDNASEESIDAMLTSGIVISDIRSDPDNSRNLTDKTLSDRSSVIPARESVKVTPQSVHSLKVTEKNFTDALEINIVGDATNQNPDIGQQAVAVPNLQENVVSKPTIPTRKDGKNDANLPRENVSKSTVPKKKDGNTNVSLPCENVVSKPTVPMRKGGLGNADVSLPCENMVSKPTVTPRKYGNTDVSSPCEKVGRKDVGKEKGVNVSATKSRDSLNGLEEIRSSILAELEELCQCHAPDSLVTCQPSTVETGDTMTQRKTGQRERKRQVTTVAEAQSTPARNQTKDNPPEATNKKNMRKNLSKKQGSVHAATKKLSEACVVIPPKGRAVDKINTSESVRPKVAQKHQSGTAQDNSGCVPQKRCRTIAVKKRIPNASNSRTVKRAAGSSSTKPSMDGDYVYFQFGGEECIHRNPFCDRTESKSELLLRLELLNGEIKRHKYLEKSSRVAEDTVLQRQRLVLQLELELLQSWLLYQGVGQLLFPGHPLPAALQLGSDGKKTVTDNQRVMLLDRVPTAYEYGKLYDLRQTLETSRKLHTLGIKGHSNDDVKPKMRQRQSMLATLLSLPSRAKLQQLQRQLADFDHLREHIWTEEHDHNGTTLMLEYLDVRCCGLEIHIKAIEGILDDDDEVTGDDDDTSTSNGDQQHKSTSDDQQHKSTPDGDQQHKLTPDGDQQHKSTPDGDQQHKSTSEGDQQQHKSTPDGDQQHKSTPDGDQQHKSTPDGDQQHKSTSEDDQQQHKSTPDGDQKHKSTPDGDQQHKSTPDGDQQHKSTPDGHQQHKSTPDGHQQHKSTSDGHQQHKSTPDGNQQHKLTPDGHQQHKSTSDNIKSGARESPETIASPSPPTNSDVAMITAEVDNSSVLRSSHNGDISTPTCNGTSTSNNTHDASESGVCSATSKSFDDSDYVECDMDMSKSSDQSDRIVCGAIDTSEVNSCSVDTATPAVPVAPATQAYDLDTATAISVITSAAQMCSEVSTWPGHEGVCTDSWVYEPFPSTNISSGVYVDCSNGLNAENDWGTMLQSSMLTGDTMANYQMTTPAPPWQLLSQPSMPPGQLYCWLVQQMSANPYLWQNAPISLQDYLLQPASFSEPTANAQWAQWLLANWQFQMGFAVPPQ